MHYDIFNCTSTATIPAANKVEEHHYCIAYQDDNQVSRIQVTHNVRTKENSNENISPAISAVGLMDATASAIVVK